jgi:copper(I)-binding protein
MRLKGNQQLIKLIAILALVIGLTACGGSPDGGHSDQMDHGDAQVETGVEVTHENLLIKNIWGRPGIEGENAAAFMTLMNKGEASERLIGIHADVANAVEIHESIIENDVMKMQQVEGGIEIPAGEDVQIKPGGYHVMFIGLTKDIKEGDSYPLKLQFEKSGEVEVEVQVHQP